MEEKDIMAEETEGYTPRPRWQVWGAWFGIVVILAGFLLYCWQIAHGGM